MNYTALSSLELPVIRLCCITITYFLEAIYREIVQLEIEKIEIEAWQLYFLVNFVWKENMYSNFGKYIQLV